MSTLKNARLVGALVVLFACCAAAHASDSSAMDADIHRLDAEWARIKYQVTDEDEQLKEIEALAGDAETVAARYPGHAEPLLWEGIFTSEEAAMASVFRQLCLAADARTLFEKAEAIDPDGLDGAAATGLGVIYYRVPGFPIAFGNNKKARHYLETALAKNPHGLDTNYFYGEFLLTQGDYRKAKVLLAHALDSPVNPERPVWDAGRRAEIRILIAKANENLRQ